MPLSRIVSARWRGSSASGGFGRPCATSQNEQRRVQTSPRIMNVAVPWLKHSWMLGQLASSQTVTRRFSRSFALRLATELPDGMRTRIHDGLRSTGAAANCTGERAIFSAATWRTPGCSDGRSPTTARGMVLMGDSLMRSGGLGFRKGKRRRGGRAQPQSELRGEVLEQPRLDRIEAEIRWSAEQFYHRGHLQPGVAAGVDAPERLQVHVHVERQSVEAATATHADAERRDLAAIDIDAGRTVAAAGGDGPVGQRVDQCLLDPVDVLAHAQFQPAQVEQRIRDDLPGAVIRDLAAAIEGDDRDLAGREHVFGFAGLAEGEHRLVLDQPQ